MSTSAKKTPADAKKPSTGAKAKTGKERPVLAGEDDEFEDFPAESESKRAASPPLVRPAASLCAKAKRARSRSLALARMRLRAISFICFSPPLTRPLPLRSMDEQG